MIEPSGQSNLSDSRWVSEEDNVAYFPIAACQYLSLDRITFTEYLFNEKHYLVETNRTS
jgi:hypothetical protein